MTHIPKWSDKPQKDPHDTMEFWVNRATKGHNPAICWQQCNRIIDQAVQQAKEEQREEDAKIAESTQVVPFTPKELIKSIATAIRNKTL